MAKIFNARLIAIVIAAAALLFSLYSFLESATMQFGKAARPQQAIRHRVLSAHMLSTEPIRRDYVAVTSLYSTKDGITMSSLARLAKEGRLAVSRKDEAALTTLLKANLEGLGKAAPCAGLAREGVAVIRAADLTPGLRVLAVDGKSIWTDSSYPLFAKVEAEPDEEEFERSQVIRLAAVGDIMLSRHVYKKMADRGYGSPFLSVAPRLSGADITLGNLETSLSNAFPPATHGMAFVAPKMAVRGLTQSGFDVLSLANNHSTNFGPQALKDTLDILSQNNIAYVGAGATEAEAKSLKTLSVKGKHFSLIAVNSILGDQRASGVRPGDWHISLAPWGKPKQKEIAEVLDKVRQAKADGDFVVVMPHWGEEYTLDPNPEMKSLARSLINAGADLVVGSHPHWVQGIETYRGGFIAYSLGNFVFDQEWSRETKQGLILEAVFYKDRLVHTELLPVIIEDFHRPRILSNSQGHQILDAVRASSLRLSIKPGSAAEGSAHR